MSGAIDWNELRARALAALPNAYAPYSGFRVAAALLADDGRVFTGANVENASYGLSVCAERNAVHAAVAAGARAFRAIAVVCSGTEPPAPCGACRQVLAEFPPAFAVHAYGAGDAVIATDTDALLPHAFGPATFRG